MIIAVEQPRDEPPRLTAIGWGLSDVARPAGPMGASAQSRVLGRFSPRLKSAAEAKGVSPPMPTPVLPVKNLQDDALFFFGVWRQKSDRKQSIFALHNRPVMRVCLRLCCGMNLI